MDTESQLALAHTCTTLYEYHKNQCKEQTFTLLYGAECGDSYISEFVKALERRMSQPGWAGVKVTLKMTRLDVQNSCEYPVKALYFIDVVDLPNGLDCASVNALMIYKYSENEFSQQNVSLFGKFSNLTSLRLNATTFNDAKISIISKLSLLEFISLHKCNMGNGHLPKIFEGCTSLQEIQLLWCNFSDKTLIKPPSQVKRFEIVHHQSLEIRCLGLYSARRSVSTTRHSKITTFVIDFIFRTIKSPE